MNTPTFDINKTDTPCYVTEECYLKRNCEILKSVQDMTGCKILLAQKAFSMYSTYPLISGYLSGTTASADEMGVLYALTVDGLKWLGRQLKITIKC